MGPGLALKGARLVRMKYCTTLAIGSTDGAGNGDTLTAPNLGFKANSIHTPGQQNGDTTYDAFGSDQAQYIYNRYRVVKSTICVENLRPTQNTGSVFVSGINITEAGANEGVGSQYNENRGTDLTAVTVKRDRYMCKPGLIGAGKTNYMNDNTVARHKMMATYYCSKWWRGRKSQQYGTEGGQDAALVDSAAVGTEDAAPGTDQALSEVTPAEPATLVYFQPWMCNASGDGSIGTSMKVTINYWVLCTGRRNMPEGNT